MHDYLTVATYNIHRCIGRDGRRNPKRIAETIRQLEPSVIGVQELESQHHGMEKTGHQLSYLAAETGLQAISGPTMRRADAEYGNGLLTQHDIVRVRRLNLSLPGREPRGALDVELDVRGTPIRVITTHLGLRSKERRWQVTQLLKALTFPTTSMTLLLIDINEWMPGSPLVHRLNRRLGRTSAPRSFPSAFPILALDRIWASPNEFLVSVKAHKTALSRIASDHLPVYGRLLIPR